MTLQYFKKVLFIFFLLLTNGIIAQNKSKFHPDFKKFLEFPGSGNGKKAFVKFPTPKAGEKSTTNGIVDPVYKKRAIRHKVKMNNLITYAKMTQSEFIAILEDGLTDGNLPNNARVYSYQSLWIINAILIEANNEFYQHIENRSDIEQILRDYGTTKANYTSNDAPGGKGTKPGLNYDSALNLIKANEIWNLGLLGQGSIVATIDSGADISRDELSTSWLGQNQTENIKNIPLQDHFLENGRAVKNIKKEFIRNYEFRGKYWYDPYLRYETNSETEILPTNYPEEFTESLYHGSKVLSLITGENTVTRNNGTYIYRYGIAPKAKWIAAASINRFGSGTNASIGDILKTMQWIADPDGNANTIEDVPDVVCNSWGLSGISDSTNPCDLQFWEAITNLEELGVFPVFAAGNDNVSAKSGTLQFPADLPNVFSVGSVNKSELVSDFSSRGPSRCELNAASVKKPDIVAPGEHVLAIAEEGGKEYVSGTSFSAAYVTGAIALLRQGHPEATVQQLKDALKTSAKDLGESGVDDDYGHGLINVKAAYDLLNECTGETIYVNKNVSPGTTDNRKANIDLIASNEIINGGSATYKAGNEVLLKDGFTIEEGGVFIAKIENCITGSKPNTTTAGRKGQKSGIDEKINIAGTGSDIYLYPNPTNGVFTINWFSELETSISVTNINGSEVLNSTFNGVTSTDIDLAASPVGMYFVKVINQKENSTIKVIKN